MGYKEKSIKKDKEECFPIDERYDSLGRTWAAWIKMLLSVFLEILPSLGWVSLSNQ